MLSSSYPPSYKDILSSLLLSNEKPWLSYIFTEVCFTILRLKRCLAEGFHLALGELRIEIRDVGIGLDKWDKWSFKLLFNECSPVDSFKPNVTFYLQRSIFSSQSVLRFLLEQVLQEVSQLMAHVGWNIGIAKLNLIKELRPTLGVERWEPHNHFIDEGSKTPPINRFSMSLLIENLGGKIFRCTTDRVGVIIGNIHFGESKVSEAEVALLIDQNIFGFQTNLNQLYSRYIISLLWRY